MDDHLDTAPHTMLSDHQGDGKQTLTQTRKGDAALAILGNDRVAMTDEQVSVRSLDEAFS